MKTIRLMLVALVLLAMWPCAAQLVSPDPYPLQCESQGVVLTYHADSPLGNKGLMGLPQSTDVYAHIGVITNLSSGSGDWKYVVTPWPGTGNQQEANTDKNRLKYVAPSTYTLTIGNIREYFGVPAGETVKQIAIVFRTGDGRKQGKTASGGDIFVDVVPDGFQMLLECDYPDRLIAQPTTMTFTATATADCAMQIKVNGTEIASASGAKQITKAYNFDKPGTYNVEASATLAGNTITKSIQIAYPDNSGSKPYPGGVPKMGAVENSDGSVTFCLAAPGKISVMLVPAWDDYQMLEKNVMNYHDYQGNRYFWITVPGLPKDQWLPYYYIVDDKYKVADPYAHLILDPYNDNTSQMNIAWRDRPRYPSDKVQGVFLAVYRGDMDDYEFSPFTIPDHNNLVIYELLLRDFTGIDGAAAGSGTIKRAMARLPYLKELGVNVIELLPIMEFSGNQSWGYNTNFYMAPDKAYGSPADYKDFVEECHRLGMAVVLDIVFNQSDGIHPWYMMYPKESNPFYNAVAPHQWSVLNDWNQNNPLVQQQWTDALRYWMEAYNVDGYRFDLVKGLGDNESYAAAGGTDQYNQSRIDRMIRLHGVIKSVKPNGIHINELLGGAREETALAEDGQLQWANINNASCQFTMGWDNGDMNLYRFLSSRDSRPWGSTVAYAESHDEERMAFKNAAYGVDGVKLPEESDLTITENSLLRLGQLAVQMLLTPGPKMVWQFGELGNGQTTKDADGGNDTGNKIVCWNYLDDPGRVYLRDTYASIINLRMEHPSLFARDATFEASSLASKFSNPRQITLTAGNKQVVAFINPAINGAPVEVAVDARILNENNAALVRASQGFSPGLYRNAQGKLAVKVPANGFAVFAANLGSGADAPVLEPEGARAYGADGRIVIVGDYTTAAVYDLSGRAMPSMEVPAGLYLVVIDGKATKVAVR